MKEAPREPPSPALAELLRASREDGPSRANLDRIARGLSLARSRPRRPSGRARILVTAGAVAGLAAGTVAVTIGSRPAVLPGPQAEQATREPPAEAGAPVSLAQAADKASPSVSALIVVPPTPASALFHAPAPVPRSPARPRAAPVPAAPEEGVATPASTSLADAGPPRTEADLLERAAIHLDFRPAEALRLVDEHRASFPSGALAEQREVLAVRALLQLGRTQEARSRAARFRQQYPGSRYLPAVEGMIGE